jgi:8-hydroxy-5-deazaflavin:NADPH oxidoreductase
MSFCRRLVTSLILITSLLPLAGRADTIAIVGSGAVASALGPRFASLGHRVVYGSRSPASPDVQELVRETGGNALAAIPSEAAALADIVLIAVPWDAAEDVVNSLGDLSGKIIIDPTNPRVVAEDGFRDYPSHTSNAERIQSAAPGAFVVKAFNTTSTDLMVDPDALGYRITIPIVGNDEAAKKTIANLLESMGYQAVDVGPIRYALVLEGLFLLRSNARDLLGTHFEYDFRVREHPEPQEVR